MSYFSKKRCHRELSKTVWRSHGRKCLRGIASSLALLAMTALAACSGQPLIQNTSGSVAQSFVIHVSAGHELVPSFDTDEGFSVELTQAELNWQHIHLISDGDDPDCEVGNDVELDVDETHDLLNEAADELLLGELAAEGDAYCQFELALVASAFEGTWAKEGQEGTFSFESSDEVLVSDTFGDHPLHFDSDEGGVSLLFEVHYDGLFDGIDFETASAEYIEQAVIDNLQAEAIHPHLESDHDH